MESLLNNLVVCYLTPLRKEGVLGLLAEVFASLEVFNGNSTKMYLQLASVHEH